MRDRRPFLKALQASTRRGALAASLLAAALLSACATAGPDYERPSVTLDTGFVNAGAAAAGSRSTLPAAAAVDIDIANFWRSFGDPALTALVERALEANGDVRIAQARLQESRAGLAQADAQSRPELGLGAGAVRSVRPITQQPGSSRGERTGNVLDAGFVANWELDLVGRFRRGSEAASALVEAGEAGLGAAHTSVAAEVARNYLELRGLQLRRQVTEAALLNQRESLQIVQARLDAGRGTELDRARATALVAGTEAALPALQTAIERSVFRLATLSAQAPRALLAQLAIPAPLPGLPVIDLAALPLGTPVQWLQRRPDVIAAERQLAAATAAIGIAQADRFPRLSLSGLLGLNAATASGLARSESALASLGVGFAWTPFDTGRIRSRIAATEARALAALAGYEQAVALALEETEGAFSGFNRSAERAERLLVAVASADEAAQLARDRYALGATDFLAVLDAERESLAGRDQWVQAQTGTATALVAVYRALGGGWNPPVEPPASDAAAPRLPAR
jgi:multidrug efflux system outer membrane protein